MNSGMQARRERYLYRKRTLLFRLVIWLAVACMVVQAAKMVHGYVTAQGIYDIYIKSEQQELTQAVVDEFKKVKGFTGFYPVYTMEAEVAVWPYSAKVFLKGIDFTHFPLKLGEVNRDALNGDENLLIIGRSAFTRFVDINGLGITEHQNEKLLQDWRGLSVIMQFGREDSSNAGKKEFRIVGILKEDTNVLYTKAKNIQTSNSLDIFISENLLRHRMEESGVGVVLREGVLQIEGLEHAAKAERVLQEGGFTMEGGWEGVFDEYGGNMRQDGAVMMIAGLFFVLAVTACRRIGNYME